MVVSLVHDVNGTLLLDEYRVNQEGTIKKEIGLEETLVLLLPENATIAYVWDVKNDLASDVIIENDHLSSTMRHPSGDLVVGWNLDKRAYVIKGSEKASIHWI